MKTTTRKTTVRKSTRRAAPLSLSARIERLEKAVLFPTPVKSTPVRVRFENLDADGRPTAGDHVAVYDHKTGLTWAAEPLGGGKNMEHAAAMKACGALTLLGQKNWRAPTIEELLSIVDYTRYDPVVDTAHFKGPFGWTWSSTPAVEPSGCAWLVGLGGGLSSRLRQGSHYRVRAVRAGQSLALGI